MIGQMEEEVGEVAEETRLEYMNNSVKVVLTTDVPKFTVAGKTYENLSKGAVINVKQWVADVLVSAGLADYVARTYNVNQLMQVEWREKNNPSDLQPLPRYFYVEWARAANEGDKELAKRLKDILTMRLMKIVSLAAKRLDGEVVKKMTPEETALHNAVYKIVDRWTRSFNLEGGE